MTNKRNNWIRRLRKIQKAYKDLAAPEGSLDLLAFSTQEVKTFLFDPEQRKINKIWEWAIDYTKKPPIINGNKVKPALYNGFIKSRKRPLTDKTFFVIDDPYHE